MGWDLIIVTTLHPFLSTCSSFPTASGSSKRFFDRGVFERPGQLNQRHPRAAAWLRPAYVHYELKSSCTNISVAVCLFSDRPKARISTALVQGRRDKGAVTKPTRKGILSRRSPSVEERPIEYSPVRKLAA